MRFGAMADGVGRSEFRIGDDDVERGWVEFLCPAHGLLVITTPRSTVRCRCGRRAKPSLNGTVLRARDIERLRKTVQKSLQMRGRVSKNGALTPKPAQDDQRVKEERYDG
jgi:hypothetical protein